MTESIEKVQKERIDWDKIFREKDGDYSPLNEILLDEILNHVRSSPKTLLDLGCGTGEAMGKFAKRGLTVTGVDISEVGLVRTQERLSSIGVEAKLSVLDLDHMESFTGQYDVIFCRLVYMFLQNRREFLERVKSLMHPYSIFILIVPVTHDWVVYDEVVDKRFLDIAIDMDEIKLRKLLKDQFATVMDLNHRYTMERNDIVTYLLMQ